MNYDRFSMMNMLEDAGIRLQLDPRMILDEQSGKIFEHYDAKFAMNCHLMKTHKLLGSGAFASVFQDPDHEDRVIKVFTLHNNFNYCKYILATRNFDSPMFPVIYDIKYSTYKIHDEVHWFVYVYMELLESSSKVNSDTSSKLFGVVTAYHRPKDLISQSLLTSIQGGNEFMKCMKFLKQSSLNFSEFELDLHSGNMMLRGDQIVITDPFVDT